MAPIPWTLQRYIFKEMGKTFVLSVIGLTGVVGLGGGVLNMIKAGDVTPGQFIRLMLIILPLAAALTLPIAALFSAASTYGRLSADNEFVACRGSGINIHVLFLPALVLSLFSALVTFVFINFVIPGMVRNLNEFVVADFGKMVRQNLSRPKGMSLPGNLRIAADNAVVDTSNPDRIDLNHVAFVEIDDEEWVRYGTVQRVSFQITRREGEVGVIGKLIGMNYYDRKARQFFQEREQVIPYNAIPERLQLRLKFLSLPGLLYYWAKPDEWRDVKEKLQKLRFAAGQLAVYDRLWADFEDDREIILGDDEARYVIRAESGWRTKREKLPQLSGVTIREERGTLKRRIIADRASLEVPRASSLEQARLLIEVYDAKIYDDSVARSIPVEKPKASVASISLDPAVIERVAALSRDDLLGNGDEDDPLVERRTEFREARAATTRRIAGILNERTSFSVSVLVLVILGAALGIVFRGSHVLTAFGISFVPLLLVIVTIVTGKQLAYNPGTVWLGLAVMWSGIVIVAVLDGWTLTRVLRR